MSKSREKLRQTRVIYPQLMHILWIKSSRRAAFSRDCLNYSISRRKNVDIFRKGWFDRSRLSSYN